jgi:hypothetical protein
MVVFQTCICTVSCESTLSFRLIKLNYNTQWVQISTQYFLKSTREKIWTSTIPLRFWLKCTGVKPFAAPNNMKLLLFYFIKYSQHRETFQANFVDLNETYVSGYIHFWIMSYFWKWKNEVLFLLLMKSILYLTDMKLNNIQKINLRLESE